MPSNLPVERYVGKAEFVHNFSRWRPKKLYACLDFSRLKSMLIRYQKPTKKNLKPSWWKLLPPKNL